MIKAIALGADACYIGTAALLALGCHLCRTCQSGTCNWGIATQKPELVKRLKPEEGTRRLVNLLTAWNHEIKEMMEAWESIPSSISRKSSYVKRNRTYAKGIGYSRNSPRRRIIILEY